MRPRPTDFGPAGCAVSNHYSASQPPRPQLGLSGRHHLLAYVGQRLYLAIWLDRYLRKVVGWDLREIMPKALVREALNQALASGGACGTV